MVIGRSCCGVWIGESSFWLLGGLVPDLRRFWLGFDIGNADVMGGISPQLENRRGIRDDGTLRRDQLDQKLGLATRLTRYKKLQIADLVGLQVPFRIPIGVARRKLAALWQSLYGDDA